VKKMNKLAALILALLMLVSATTAFAGTYVSDPVSPTISKPDDGGQQPELEATPAPEGEAVLEPTPAPEGEQIAEETPAPQEIEATVQTESEGGSVNIRAAASTDSEILGQLDNSARVTVLGVEGDWAIIRADSITGYVFSKYLALSMPEETSVIEETAVPEETSVPVEVEQPDGETVTITTSGSTDLRVTPDGMSEIILTIPGGTELSVLAVEGDWLKVSFEGEVGYIFSPSQPNGDEQSGEEEENVVKKVVIFSSRRSQMAEGEPVTLSCLLEGFDGYEIRYQWECDTGSGYTDVPGANGATFAFQATAETLSYGWRLRVLFR